MVLVFMRVCRYGVGGRSQFDLVSPARHDTVARFQSGEDLHPLAIVTADGH